MPSGAPVNVHIVSMGSRSISLSWSPPLAALQNGKLTGYIVGYRSGLSTVRYVKSEADSRLNMTVSNLNPYSTYTLTVRAYNAKGEGPNSPPLVVQTQQDGKTHCSILHRLK